MMSRAVRTGDSLLSACQCGGREGDLCKGGDDVDDTAFPSTLTQKKKCRAVSACSGSVCLLPIT